MWCSCGLFLMWWCGEKGVRPGRDRVEGGVRSRPGTLW